MKRILTAKAAVAFCLAPSLASASLLIDGGGITILDTAVGQSVVVSNGSELRLIGNGSITGDGTNPGGLLGGALSGSPINNGVLRLSGNSVVNAGADQY